MSSDFSSIDYNEVLRVMPETFQETWKDNPDVLLYLSYLGSLGLQRLNQEPECLSEKKVSILEQTQDLAFHNYQTFIQTAECSQKIFHDFNVIESRLDSLLKTLPVFKEKSFDFSKEAQQINTRWRQVSVTLAKHPQLLEFLEMPQLMDNSVKAGFYDEALELLSYVKRLERKHSDIPLLKNIILDIQSSTNGMLSQLLNKLQSNIQLPECLKIVGYLRRMDVFNESELRMKFLQARDSWFKKVIDEIDRNDPYQHVIKIIESSRIHLFDIITQYRAIFSDDDPLLLVRDSSRSNCAIFHSWITIKISWFLSILENDLSFNLGGRIDSVFAQCMYFGLSFSRVCIDFRPLLVPVFQRAVFKKFQSDIEVATSSFERAMRIFAFSPFTKTTILLSNLSDESVQPPSCLLDFPPLAQYCNDILNALNELKLCCMYAISSNVIQCFYLSLNRIVNAVMDAYYQRKRAMNELDNENFIQICNLISFELIPHLNKCLAVVYPSDDLAEVLGITSIEFGKMNNFFALDANEISKPLEIIFPNRKDDDDVGLMMTFKDSSTVENDIKQSVTDPIFSSNDTILENPLAPTNDIKNSQDSMFISENVTLDENLASNSVAKHCDNKETDNSQLDLNYD